MRRSRAIGAVICGGLVFLAAGLRMDVSGTGLARLVIFGVALGAVVATDLAEHRIPNRIVVPAAAACAVLVSAEAVPPQQLLGGLAVVALMLTLSVVSPTSFGMGDVKLAFLVVVGLGGLAFMALVLGLVFASAFGALLMLRHGRIAAGRSVPLAPFLGSAAALVVLL